MKHTRQDDINYKLASGLEYAVFRNGEVYSEYPLMKEDAEYYRDEWAKNNPKSTWTVDKWPDNE